VRPVPGRRPGRWAATLALLVVVAGLAILARVALRGPAVDPGLHVVLPFAERAEPGAGGITGADVESLLYDAMSQWGDVRLVGEIRAHDAWAQVPESIPTLSRALAVARRLGAGLLAWGETDPLGDSIAVRAGLYDVAHGGATVEEHEVRLPRAMASLGDVATSFRELAAALLLRRPLTERSETESLGTSYVAAWTPYLAGTDALNRLDVARAESLFVLAVRADPGFARAQLALAQIADWAGRPETAWLASARSAVEHADRLPTARDSALAWGLLALAERRFQDACERFRVALRRDSMDVSAWFGLGECQRRDTIVVRDPRGPTGWRFRGSYEGAVRAYRRALDIAPSFNLAFGDAAFSRLARLLVAEPYLVRWGGAAAPDTGAFMAWPALDHDTLVLVPYRRSAAVVVEAPASHARAVERGRTMLDEVVQRWVTAFPRNPSAHAAWSRVLELQGRLADEGPSRPSAVREVREALRLERDPATRLRLRLADLRLRVKLYDLGSARRLADSLLRDSGPGGPDVDVHLASVAALTGRARLTADLLARSATDSSFRLPAGSPLDRLRPATAAALRLLGYASLGEPVDSLVAMEARVDTLVRRWVDPRLQTAVRRVLSSDAQLNAFPTRGWSPLAGPSDGYFLSDAQWLLSRGDTAAARARLREARRVQAGFSSSDVLPQLAYQEAYILAAVGDTAAAESFLDLSLENLQAAPTMLLAEPPQAAALVRAMALRSELAARRREPARARRWAAAVDTLWSGGDPEVRAYASRLRLP
jgi:tetratricopeptide (TPR) repeat protein